jgi:hypothetical protein
MHIICGAPLQNIDVLLTNTQKGYRRRYCIDGPGKERDTKLTTECQAVPLGQCNIGKRNSSGCGATLSYRKMD